MNFELQEFGNTIAIGMYMLFAIGFILFLFFRTISCRMFRNFIVKLPSSILFIIIGVIALSLGILMEQLSDKHTDYQGLFFIDSEAKIRTRVLFEENGSLTSLGLELHRHGVLDAFGYRTVGKLTDLTDPLYYFAKNIVFTYENYFQELRDIQVRIDFIRSFAIISLLLFLSSIIRLVSAWVSKDNTGDLDGEGKIMIENDKVVYAMLCCSIAFLLLWWASIQGYEYEEEQFNERVYGYFSTLVASGKESIPIIANMTPPSISGLTTLKEASKEHRFAVVDSKDSFTSRIFRIDRDQMSIYFEPLIVDWGKHSVPTDLEGICSAGSSIWVLESSRWRNNIPRLMELRQDQQPMWNVDRVVELPNIKNIEGLECNRAKDEELWFLFGERGEGNENTELIRYRLNDKGGVAYLQNSPRYTIESPLKAPFHRVRHISDLEIINNTLVISSARDGGDSGPFESVIFSVACINDDMSIQGEISTTVWLETTEMKIEGVTEGWEPRTLLVLCPINKWYNKHEPITRRKVHATHCYPDCTQSR